MVEIRATPGVKMRVIVGRVRDTTTDKAKERETRVVIQDVIRVTAT